MLACAVAGCSDKDTGSSVPDRNAHKSESSSEDAPLRAIATVGMVADLVREVGGDHVVVTQIMGSGVDPHLYKVTRDDVQTIMGSDIVFYSGLMLEGKMADTLVKVARSRPVVAVTEMLDERDLLEPDDFEGNYDPHVWMDVALWSKCVDVVATALTEVRPNNAKTFQANATAYIDRLEELHAYGTRAIASIPETSRVLVTSHDAFNYMGRAYGLDVQGVQGISTESEAGLQRVNELVSTLTERNVKAVFIESSVPRKSIDALVEGAAARGHRIRIGGELFSDAMGETDTYKGTYIGMLDHNFTTVTRSLGGNAPEGGLNGRLAH